MNKLNKYLLLFLISLTIVFSSMGQDAGELVQNVRNKLDKVTDYEASGKMKTNVAFLKVPIASVTVYFKKPGKLKIKNQKGFSFIPRGAVNINMSNILNSGKYTVLDAGSDKIGNIPVKVVKLLPLDDNGDMILSTLFIDEQQLVILKAKTTTRDNGSYELEMSYGKYVAMGLPDKVIFSFNTKDYKLPKGVTFDFDSDIEKKTEDKPKKQKGRAEISFFSYIINKGVSDAVFQ